MRRRHALLIAIALLAAPSAAQAEGIPAACPGDPINVAQVITGEFGADLQGGYVDVPIDVPAGTTSVRVKYCYDQPATAQQRSSSTRSTSGSTSRSRRATPSWARRSSAAGAARATPT